MHPISIIGTDLDRLKSVNDIFGHTKGDELLINYSGILKKTFRKSDIVARIGGDEFFVILPRTDEYIANSIVDRLNKNIDLYNKKNIGLPIMASIGVSSTKKQSDSLFYIFKEADNSMYQNKKERAKEIIKK